jgi:hypothetical protein
MEEVEGVDKRRVDELIGSRRNIQYNNFLLIN